MRTRPIPQKGVKGLLNLFLLRITVAKHHDYDMLLDRKNKDIDQENDR